MSSPVNLWPVKAQGAVQRLTFASDTQIEKQFHKALEQGRVLESSVADANFYLASRQRDLMEKINHFLACQKLAVDGQTKLRTRFFLYAADAVNFIKQVKSYTSAIQSVVGSVTSNLNQLEQIEANMLQMLNADIAALTTLLNEICNWGLPNLASIPALLGFSGFTFNGFNFSNLQPPNLKGLLPSIPGLPSIPKNFSFSQCSMNPPSGSTAGTLFTAPPTTVSTATAITPPLSGTIASDPTQYTDPTFIAQMQSTTAAPVYTSTFNGDDMQGSLPDPSTIISNYSLPPATYAANILSTVSALESLVQPVGTTITSAMQAAERAAFVRFVTLDEIVASNYDPNLTAAWLFYINAARQGRGGSWITNFQQIYSQYVSPSIAYLNNNAVPWNNVLGGSGVTAGPQAIPLIAALQADTTNVLKWELTYIEAALLGYTRSQTWESAANVTYLSGYTGNELDYVSTTFVTLQTTPVVVGQGTATFPVTMNIPKALLTVMTAVIAVGAQNISFDKNYVTNRPQFRFTYDEFANATQVDRFTQYWRTFNYNFQQLLLQSAYALGFVVTYEDTLDSAIDPLGNAADYNSLLDDANSRNQSWVSGTPLLPIPFAPDVVASSSFVPDISNNGWIGNDLNVDAFLSRPDIAQLPIPAQLAMLRTNLSFAALVKNAQALQAELSTQIANAQALIAQAPTAGFEVSGATGTIPAVGALTLSFPTTVFDITGNVTSSNAFTIQTAGSYVLSGTVGFGTGTGSFQVVITINGVATFTSMATDSSTTGPIDVPFTTTLDFNSGDVIQVEAISSAGTQAIISGDLLVIQVPPSGIEPVGPPPAGASTTTTFFAGATLAILTAVQVESEETVFAIDTVDQGFFASPPTPATAPRVDGITVQASTGLPATVVVGTVYGATYSVPNQGWTPGGLLYAGPGGLLTQDYLGTIAPNCYWIVVVGRAVTDSSFIFEPNLPTSSVGNF